MSIIDGSFQSIRSYSKQHTSTTNTGFTNNIKNTKIKLKFSSPLRYVMLCHYNYITFYHVINQHLYRKVSCNHPHIVCYGKKLHSSHAHLVKCQDEKLCGNEVVTKFTV